MANTKYRPYWFKTNLCTLMGISLSELNTLVSDECKKRVNWKEGIQKFRDFQVTDILQDIFREKNTDEIRVMIGYKPQFDLNFEPKTAK